MPFNLRRMKEINKLSREEIEEIERTITEIRSLKKEMRFRSYKTQRSKLDKFRAQIEYIRYGLKSPVNEIHLWLRRKHHLKMSERAIEQRLKRWKEKHE